MRKLIFLLLIGIATTAQAANPRIQFETTSGNFVIELYAEQAPNSTRNFLAYVNSGFFTDTIFHRVIPGFVIQGGGFTPDMQRKSTEAPIKNEAYNGLKNRRGTLSMARTQDPHSATSQFFVNLVDNQFLDHSGQSPRGWGYAVFGEIVEGMAVIDEIAKAKTGRVAGMSDVPLEPTVVTKASVLDSAP